MSVYSGPQISKNGLILDLDPANRKSWAGIGNDRIGNIVPVFNNWNGLVGTSTQYTDFSGKQAVYLKITNANGGGVNWWTSTTGTQTCSPSTQYIVSARIKYSGDTPSANLFYVRQFNSGGSQTSESGKYSSANQIDIGNGYYLAWAYFTTDSTATSFYIHGYNYSNIEIWLEDVQCKIAGLSDLSGNDNHHLIAGTANFSNNNFTLDGSTSGYVRTTALNSVSSNCTVVLWYASTDTQELWVRGNQNNGYYLAAAAGGNYYHAACGSPTNYVDLNTTVRPDSPVNYRNGQYHMWEAKNVDFSGWSYFEWFLYPGSWQMYGNVSKILVYNRLLTDNESAQNFQALRSRFGI